MSVVFAGLHPHPPIVVPEVGRDRLAECRSTYEACRAFARRLVAHRPDRLVLLSPHAPRPPDGFGVQDGPRLVGDLSAFGAPQARVDLPNDLALARDVARAAAERGIPVYSLPPAPLDHGSVVPLVFLTREGYAGPTLVISLPAVPEPGKLVEFGRALGEALERARGRTAIVASGDMTHRAIPGAPAGYHPRAVEFDRTLVELVERGRLDAVPAIDPALREVAAEDAADTVTIAAAATDFRGRGTEVLSYEHPFGVGYLVAVLDEEEER